MTRYLSEALEAQEPWFSRGLTKLEAASGHPSDDIRFSEEVMRAARAKIQKLGLDPRDTTGKELYEALKQRLKEDDQRLIKRLRTLAAQEINAEADTSAGLALAINKLPNTKHCFALKNPKLKSLLKATPPKKTMKRLGYRSIDSLLKHEPAALVLAAAVLSESSTWQKRFVAQYRSLIASDFEGRTISILQPTSGRWLDISREEVDRLKHNIIAFKELGTVIVLPLPKGLPPGGVTASLALSLHEINEIRAASTFLKLSQVKTNFGELVVQVSQSEPLLSSDLLDEPVSWNLLHRYYSRAAEHFSEALFEPYLQLEDMVWPSIEKMLASIEPSFAFWQNTTHLGLLHDRRPVSLNLIDSALNLCNDLPLEQRLAHYFKKSLWQELLMSYLKHEPAHAAVVGQLQPAMAEERVLA